MSVADEDEKPVLGYGKPDGAEGPPSPPLHFWVRLVLFAMLAGAVAWPALIRR